MKLYVRGLFFFLLIFPTCFVFAQKKPIKLHEIPEVMEQLFDYHIDHKELTPTIAKRMIKIYIEQFDMQRFYLLEKEVQSFFKITDEQAKYIIKRMRKGDFSDFKKINDACVNAIERARENRKIIFKEIVNDNISLPGCPISAKDNHERQKNQVALFQKLKTYILQFFSCHEKAMILDNENRREQLFSLLEKRLVRYEDSYLSKDEKYFTLHLLKAFAKSLDAHSAFFSDEEAHEMRMNLEKQFEGIGVVLTEGIDGIIITDILKNSPAYYSKKIEVDDIIVEINGRLIKDMKFEDVLLEMRPRNNKEITLGLARVESIEQLPIIKPMWRVKLKCKPIVMEEERLSYSYEPYGNSIIGMISLKSFYENNNGLTAEKDLKEAISFLQSKGNLKGLVLDLRENAGGFLSQAVKVAGVFLTNGVVVISKYAQGEMKYLRSMNFQKTFHGPLIILTSKLSASASEIVAQTLQDYGVALVVGDSRTFGKGSIQYQTVTDENSDIFFKITVGKYYTVSGKSTQIEGVRADIVVPTAISPYPYGERFLEYPLPNDRIAAAYNDPLTDLDSIARKWFKKNYIPMLQKRVAFWQKLVPQLRKNSEYRLNHDPNFKEFTKKLEATKKRLDGKKETTKDKEWNYGTEDLQIIEAKNILKDMIYLEAKSRQKS